MLFIPEAVTPINVYKWGRWGALLEIGPTGGCNASRWGALGAVLWVPWCGQSLINSEQARPLESGTWGAYPG
jgi:hypothetical protein